MENDKVGIANRNLSALFNIMFFFRRNCDLRRHSLTHSLGDSALSDDPPAGTASAASGASGGSSRVAGGVPVSSGGRTGSSSSHLPGPSRRAVSPPLHVDVEDEEDEDEPAEEPCSDVDVVGSSGDEAGGLHLPPAPPPPPVPIPTAAAAARGEHASSGDAVIRDGAHVSVPTCRPPRTTTARRSTGFSIEDIMKR